MIMENKDTLPDYFLYGRCIVVYRKYKRIKKSTNHKRLGKSRIMTQG